MRTLALVASCVVLAPVILTGCPASQPRQEAPSRTAAPTRPLTAPIKPPEEPLPVASKPVDRGPPPTRAECEQAADKVLALVPPPPTHTASGSAQSKDDDSRARVIDECLRSPRAEVDCVLAAEQTDEAMLACFQWDEPGSPP